MADVAVVVGRWVQGLRDDPHGLDAGRDALAETCVGLAESVAAKPERAALWRELLRAIALLRGPEGDDDAEFRAILAELAAVPLESPEPEGEH